jgi:hypothetical protein
MHPRNLPAVVPDVELLELDDEVDGDLPLDPHAAVSRAATVRTAPTRMVCLTACLLFPWRPVKTPAASRCFGMIAG